MSDVVEFLPQQRIRHGVGSLDHLAAELEALGAGSVLLLSTPPLQGSALLDGVVQRLGARCRRVMPIVTSHAPVQQVIEAARAAAEAEADTIVALGGGSVIDAAKIVAACLQLRRFDEDVVNDARLKGQARSAWGETWRCKVLAIPTTLAAAEFTHLAGVAVPRESRKALFAHPRLTPAAALLDPRGVQDTPLPLLLSSGIRALDHAVERICSVHRHPYGHVLSIEAVKALVASLHAAHADPQSLQARGDCQYGAWLSMAGFCAPSPFGASHGIGYLLGVAKGIEHGLTSCVYLPAVLAFNEPVLGDVRDDLVRALGGRDGDSPATLLRDCIAALNLPTTYTALGLDERDLEDVARAYDGTGPIATNPRAVAGGAQLLEILRSAR